MRFLIILAATILCAAAPPQPRPIVVPAIDFALDWRNYMGRRVTVIGKFYSVDVDGAAISLPGTLAYVDLKGVPRDTIKYLILNCQMGADVEKCRMPVTGDVVKNKHFDHPQFLRVEVLLPPS